MQLVKLNGSRNIDSSAAPANAQFIRSQIPAGNQFKVEYAPTGRATCKVCRSSIAKGSLRIGKVVPARHFDGNMNFWYHLDCFKTLPQQLHSMEELEGLRNISHTDQQQIQQTLGLKFILLREINVQEIPSEPDLFESLDEEAVEFVQTKKLRPKETLEEQENEREQVMLAWAQFEEEEARLERKLLEEQQKSLKEAREKRQQSQKNQISVSSGMPPPNLALFRAWKLANANLYQEIKHPVRKQTSPLKVGQHEVIEID